MKFNYQSEKIKYIRTWEKLEAEYRRAGMNEAAIKAMKAFDWEMFKQERIFCIHNQYLDDREVADCGENSLCKRFTDLARKRKA